MIKKAALAAAVLATLSSLPAHADLSFNVGAVTDYRYRGISQSRLDPALQGGADWVQSADGGFYAGVWASTIRWIKDAGRINGFDAGNARVEVDLYGGYKGSVMEGLGYDVGVLQYWYPRNKLDRAPTLFEKADTTEVYGALTFGPVTAKYSHALTDTFGNLDSKNSWYLDLSASFEITDGWMLVPHVGRQKIKGPSDDLGGSYTDYSLGISKDFSGFVVSATAVGTNADKTFYVTPSGKFTGKNALVVGVKYNF
ncbi:TorF family putative porin [Azohydromonas aeria]|uniref:TorF family putative porin n=1 Tax=Azohydromonas aeria TaxID=2590212 RepID=UPI0012FC6555|nr:TorF family putative porin [Azohydromonas aeria]